MVTVDAALPISITVVLAAVPSPSRGEASISTLPAAMVREGVRKAVSPRCKLPSTPPLPRPPRTRRDPPADVDDTWISARCKTYAVFVSLGPRRSCASPDTMVRSLDRVTSPLICRERTTKKENKIETQPMSFSKKTTFHPFIQPQTPEEEDRGMFHKTSQGDRQLS